MTSAVLMAVSDGMTACGLSYALMEWKGKPVYPYFVGEYQETESMTEDGKQECTFILSGFTRGSWSDLEMAKSCSARLISLSLLAVKALCRHRFGGLPRVKCQSPLASSYAQKYFNRISGKTVIADNGSAVAIFYANSLLISLFRQSCGQVLLLLPVRHPLQRLKSLGQ